MKKKINLWVPITGLAIGIAAVVLTALGNPKNMGFCIACFLRDIAGALKLQTAGVKELGGTGIVQYVRPEIIGLVLGSTIMAVASKEFKARAGSSPAIRFLLGAFVMIGALVFLGCPLRMVIRMGGGDLNAFVGLVGFAIGILIGIFFLKKGFTLKRSYPVKASEGLALPVTMLVLLGLFLIVPGIFALSTKGPGSMHANFFIALGISLVVGALAQKSRICMVGGMRDAIMFRDFNLLAGFGVIFVTVLVGNLILKNFHGFSTVLQPIAHSSQLWNLLGMVIVGWGSVLLGGCPLRQLILAGEGNGDSAVTVFGMIAGAAIAHNFGLAGAADAADAVTKEPVVGGISTNGKVAVALIFGALLLISVVNTFVKKEKKQ